MVSLAPTAAASTLVGISDRVAAYIATAKSATADGITWAEFGELLVGLLRLCVQTLDSTAFLTGQQKKELAITASAVSFADRCVPLLAYPFWVVARAPVKLIVLAIASGAVEILIPLTRAA